MALKLASATVDERNAVFSAVHSFVQSKESEIPWMYREIVANQLESPQGRALLLQVCDIAIEAYEKAHGS